jgi:S1-C subfamily serine protease
VVGDGLRVVTNAHVTKAAEKCGCGCTGPGGAGTLRRKRLDAAPGCWNNHEQDLALLQIDGPAVAALSIGASDQVREGEDFAFMGFPVGGLLGFSSVTHRAIVSSITTMALPSPTSQQLSERAIRSMRSGPQQVFQLDATAYPGNSGGPLFDPRSGAVFGVISMVLVKGTRESALSQPSGITYAIPSRYVSEMLARHP